MIHNMAAYCPKCLRVSCRCHQHKEDCARLRDYDIHEPRQEDLRGQRLRKYDVIIQHFNQIVEHMASRYVPQHERHSEIRTALS